MFSAIFVRCVFVRGYRECVKIEKTQKEKLLTKLFCAYFTYWLFVSTFVMASIFTAASLVQTICLVTGAAATNAGTAQTI